PAPRPIAQVKAEGATWSPDGKRLAFGSCDLLEDQAYATILSENGGKLAHFKIGGCGATWGGYLDWLTNDTLIDPLIYGWDLTVYEYYNAVSGKSLGFYYDSLPNSVQPPALSPNKRWHILEEFSPSSNYPAYLLYDLRRQSKFIISDNEMTFVKFMGWSPDNAGFYLVSRPVSETATSQSPIPFGF